MIKALKPSAGGGDGVCNKLLKQLWLRASDTYSGATFELTEACGYYIRMITEFVNLTLRLKTFHHSLQRGEVIPLFKGKGSSFDLNQEF